MAKRMNDDMNSIGAPNWDAFSYAERRIEGAPYSYDDPIEAAYRLLIEYMLKQWREDRARLKAVTAEAKAMDRKGRSLADRFLALQRAHNDLRGATTKDKT